MNKNLFNTFLAGLGFTILLLASCKKNNEVVDQAPLSVPAYAKFNTLLPGDTLASYYINSSNNTFKLPIGVTNVSDKDRTINISYTSNTAVQGVQYTAPTSIVIKAGQALDSLTISGLFSGYPSSTRIDTLIIRITGGDGIAPINYAGPRKDTYRLVMRKYCDVVLNSFLGVYANTTETFGTGSPYGPYTATISSVTPLTATTASIVIQNIWDNGWGPLTFLLNWTNPAAFSATVVAQTAIPGSNAGDLSGTYAGLTVAVRPLAGQVGTFSSCEGTLTLRMQLGVTNVGYFANLYQVNMKR